MFDVRIKNDGRLNLDHYDLTVTTYEQYLAQKIYRAVMDMNPGDFSGINVERKQEVTDALRRYFLSYFNGDPDIDGRAVVLELVTPSVGQHARFTLSYSGRSPNGRPVDIHQGFDYSFTAGALESVDLDPRWLITSPYQALRSINHIVHVSDYTREIELPVHPYLVGFDAEQTLAPVYLLTEAMLEGGESRTESFSIEVTSERILYPISRYLEDFSSSTELISAIDIEDTDLDYSESNLYGEPTIVCREPGTITGTATILNALQSTSSILIRNEVIGQSVYPLRPVREKYLAVFPKTISPGVYVLQYTGIVKEQ